MIYNTCFYNSLEEYNDILKIIDNINNKENSTSTGTGTTNTSNIIIDKVYQGKVNITNITNKVIVIVTNNWVPQLDNLFQNKIVRASSKMPINYYDLEIIGV